MKSPLNKSSIEVNMTKTGKPLTFKCLNLQYYEDLYFRKKTNASHWVIKQLLNMVPNTRTLTPEFGIAQNPTYSFYKTAIFIIHTAPWSVTQMKAHTNARIVERIHEKLTCTYQWLIVLVLYIWRRCVVGWFK